MIHHCNPSPRFQLRLFLGITAFMIGVGAIGLAKLRDRALHLAGDHQALMTPTHQPLWMFGLAWLIVAAPVLVLLWWTIRRMPREGTRQNGALRDSDERLRTAQFSANAGVFDWNLHSNALTWTPELEVLSGLKTGTVRFYEDFRRLVHPDDLAAVEARQDAAIRNHQPFELEFRIIHHASGEIRWLSSRGEAVYDEAGRPLRVIGNNIDITKRKQAEEALARLNASLEQQVVERTRALRQSDARLDLAVRSAHVGIFEYDHRTDELYWSPTLRSIYGVRAEEPASLQGYIDRTHPHERETVSAAIRQAHDPAGDGLYNVEHRVVRPDGSVRWVSVRSQTYFEGSGTERRPIRTIGAILDISDRKQVEAALRHAQKMEAIGTLAGGIAHEFNNSLTAILGFSELVLKKIPGDTRAHAQIQQVIKAGRRSRDLVHQILTFSRQTEQERRPLSLHGLVKEAVKLLRPTLPPTIELHEFIASPTHPVLADPTQLHQVVLHLWTNSVHAMCATGGRLDIRLENVAFDADTVRGGQRLEQGAYVRFLVQDTGIGMDPEVKARMFDPFFTTKDVDEHTGMGLAVVYGIVTGHGGRLCVESWPGHGTKVEVYLPAISLNDAAEPSSDVPLPRGHECVLFVEDEESLAELGREMLESLGYYTVVRTSAADALVAFSVAPQRFDLVITDYVMPHMTGDRLAQELSRLRPDIPILLCTGTPLPLQSLLCSCIRATLHKPLLAREAATAIRSILDRPVTNGTPRASVPSINEELHAVGPDR